MFTNSNDLLLKLVAEAKRVKAHNLIEVEHLDVEELAAVSRSVQVFVTSCDVEARETCVPRVTASDGDCLSCASHEPRQVLCLVHADKVLNFLLTWRVLRKVKLEYYRWV